MDMIDELKLMMRRKSFVGANKMGCGGIYEGESERRTQQVMLKVVRQIEAQPTFVFYL